jgi:glycosyltransferase involved in cell wall biosynthesis
VFVTASHYEGWGLPGAEAMACGAALVSTDHGGVRAYAEHGVTALISPIRRPDMLAEHVELLLRNPGLRVRIAEQGAEAVRQFTWERAVSSFEQCLIGDSTET